MTDVTTTDDLVEDSSNDATGIDEEFLVEPLIEKISIDGMCGVY